MKVTLTNTWTNFLTRKMTVHWCESWLQNPKHTSKWSPCRSKSRKSHKSVNPTHNPIFSWSQNAQRCCWLCKCNITCTAIISTKPPPPLRRDEVTHTNIWTNILMRMKTGNWHESVHFKLNFKTQNILQHEVHAEASHIKVIHQWIIHTSQCILRHKMLKEVVHANSSISRNSNHQNYQNARGRLRTWFTQLTPSIADNGHTDVP